jgi:hypothetical protein
MYGYLRVSMPGMGADGDGLDNMDRGLRVLATAEDFCFATTFYEPAHLTFSAFEELVQELIRADAHHVATPSLEHLSPRPGQQQYLLTRLGLEASARVWTLNLCPSHHPAATSTP